MRFTVIGAGAIGSAMAYELVHQEAVTNVKVCDDHARNLKALQALTDSPKFGSIQADARDTRVHPHILNDSDGVIACVPPQLNPMLARACLERGIHFFDLGGDEATVRQELAMNDEARDRGVWIVPNCGLTPGLVNILSRLGIQHFERVEAIRLRVGDVPATPVPPFNFRLSWTADKIIDDYTNPACFIQDGQVTKADALTGLEPIEFPEPFGTMEAFRTDGGLAASIDDLAGHVPHVDHKTIRWPGHAEQMQFLLGLGFADRKRIDVKTHLTYRDILVRRLKHVLGGKYEDVVLLRVVIQGINDGRERTLVYELTQRHDEDTGLSAIQQCTSISTVSVARLITSGAVPQGGALPADRVVPLDDYMASIRARGLAVKEDWREGYV